ncbi:hypothetical protein [Ideonella livida]|uniref:Uncharacterized protein n=1 Tax=Ideonella livida TaxID=2707176 RepID=A0A7C9PJL0_9BURK|nr:hypothetical protein [Ideonella livida]NDY92690.1 hypothetical protein [Ideonella livida]
MPCTLPPSRPRNPLALPARQRAAGPHRTASRRRQQQAQRELHSQLRERRHPPDTA